MAILICQTAALYAMSDAEGVGLGKIVVTSNHRAASYLGQASEGITVIGAEEIRNTPARDLGELLSYTSQVDVQPVQGFGRATSLSIRGSDSRQVRVMIDGIPLNSQSSGQMDPAELPVENIDRVEILKGAGSSVWGSALGGVINVVTKPVGNTVVPKGEISAAYGGYGTQKQSSDISGKAGRLGYYAFLSRMLSSGKGPRDDVSELKSFAKVSYDMEKAGKLNASFGHSQGDPNSGKFPDDSWSAQPYILRYGKLGWQKRIGGFDSLVEFKHSRQDIVNKSFGSVLDEELWGLTRTRNVLSQLSFNTSSRPRSRDLFVAGADIDYDLVKSSNYILSAKRLLAYAPYANYTYNTGPWDFTSALRYDHNSEFGQSLSPSWGAVYHFSDRRDSALRGNVSRAFHAPPLLWKYNDDPVFSVAANPDLQPEHAWVYELGASSNPLTWLYCSLSVYRSDVTDAIESAQNDAGMTYKKNFQRVRRQGAEGELRAKVAPWLSLVSSAAFHHLENRLNGEMIRGGSRPRQSFRNGIVYHDKRGLGISLLGNYTRWNEPAVLEPNDRKIIWDVKITQTWKKITPFFNIYNITNSKYWSDSYFPLKKRYFEGGLSMRW